MNCAQCGGEGVYLGSLGALAHLRCRQCGWQWSANAGDVIDDNDEEIA